MVADDTPQQPRATPPPDPADADESAGLRLRASWRAEAERWSGVSAHLPLGLGGGLRATVGMGQRAIRQLLRWYINPIVEQQNRANAAFLSLEALDHAQRLELARELAALRARVAELERRLGDASGRA